MRVLTKKLGRAVVAIMCAAMMFQSVGITAMAGEPIVAETDMTQAQVYEEQLKSIGQSAIDKLASKCSAVENVEANMDGIIVKANDIYNAIQSATKMDQKLLNKVNSYEKQISNAESTLTKAYKAYNTAQSIIETTKANFERNLTKAQKNEPSVTGSEGSALIAQAETTVSEYQEFLVIAEQKAEQIREIQQAVWEAFSQKPVEASFFVLDRGKEIPEGIWGKQKDYSVAIIGELYSGVEVDGQSDYSYLTIYHNDEILYSDVYNYIKEEPTRDDINVALALKGDQLAENEIIEWYGISTVSGIIHVDGRIVEIESDDPTGGNDDPNGDNDDPNGGNDDPTGGNDDPTGGNDDPTGGNDDPNGGNDDPTGGNDDPTGGNDDPTGGNDDPTGGNDDPTGGNDDPTGGNDDPTGGNDDPTGGNDEPTGGNDEPTGGNDDPTGGNDDPTGGNDDPTGGNDDPNGGNDDPNGGNDDPNGGNDDPTGGNDDPTGGNDDPTDDDNTADDDDTTEDEVVEIEEEDTPLTDAIEENGETGIQEVVEIEEEEAPLASGVCRTHWYVLALVMVYAIVQIVCVVSRNKKIKEMEEEIKNIVM